MTTLSTATTPPQTWETGQWGYRKVTSPQTGEPVLYQRTSTFARTLDSGGDGLAAWYAWMTLKGADVLPDIAREAVMWTGDRAPKPLVERLKEAGGGNQARDVGSIRHETVAMALQGAKLEGLPLEARAELDLILTLIRGLGEPIAIEAPIITDEYEVAGHCDFVLRDPAYGKITVADLKTGKSVSRLSAGIQLVSYARGNYWQGGPDGERGPIVCEQRPRLVILHAPQTGSAPILIDIDPIKARGWADLAVKVRDARRLAGQR